MEVSNSSVLLLLLAAVSAAAWYKLDSLYAPTQYPNEPPLVPQSIPYVGHILGLLRHGTRYYGITSAKCKLPIYTLNMLSGKVYVVTAPDLVTAVHRNSKKLAFNPFIAQLGKRITGHDEATSQIVQHNLNGENGHGYVIDVHDGIVASLAPGKDLEQMTKAMLRRASPYLDRLAKDGEVNLFEWIRDMVTMCSTGAIYGPENPFDKNSKFVKSFWEFDHDLNLLMADVAPDVLAPKGYRARMELAVAFRQYYENYNPANSQSSAMIQARYNANIHHGITPENQGRLEVGTLIGILANTIPAVFYMIIHIYSDPVLIVDIRNELDNNGHFSMPDEVHQNFSFLTMQETYPLLYSTFQEVLRVHAMGGSARFVREDVMLDDTYLLRKGMVVQMPMAVMHSDAAAWGEDVSEFQPQRFLKPKAVSKAFKQNLTAYRPFGGGASLCPGRHFVSLEVMVLAAWMVSRFDLAPVDGEWCVPPQKQESLATNVFPPAKDIRVKFTARQGLGK